MGLNNEVLGNAGKKSLNSYHKSLIINGLWIQDFCRAAGSIGGGGIAPSLFSSPKLYFLLLYRNETLHTQ